MTPTAGTPNNPIYSQPRRLCLSQFMVDKDKSFL